MAQTRKDPAGAFSPIFRKVGRFGFQIGQDLLNGFGQISFPGQLVEAFLAGADENGQGLVLFLGVFLGGQVITGPVWADRGGGGGDEIGKREDSQRGVHPKSS